jgi:cytidylate kinase
MIIVIDGPAGAGKSTTAKAAARKLDIKYLDSGALYRAITWLYIKSNDDRVIFVKRLKNASVAFWYDDGTFHVSIDGNDVTRHLRSDTVSETVSDIASLTEVRSFVNSLMHKAVEKGQYVAEGRDLGTAVFPEADLKFFLTASSGERARRRYKELQQAGDKSSLDHVVKNIAERDRKDSSREINPLKKAPDAIEIDTSTMSFNEQVERICTIIQDNTSLKFN